MLTTENIARPEAATKRAAVGSTSDAWETRTPPGVKNKGDSPQSGAEGAENPKNCDRRILSYHQATKSAKKEAAQCKENRGSVLELNLITRDELPFCRFKMFAEKQSIRGLAVQNTPEVMRRISLTAKAT